MTDRFYLGLSIIFLVLALLVFVAPQLRLRHRERLRKEFEDWYAAGPTLESRGTILSTFVCDFCGGRALSKKLVGSYEQKQLLKRLNHVSVDEARFYEHRCTKCNSLIAKEKHLIAPTNPIE